MKIEIKGDVILINGLRVMDGDFTDMTNLEVTISEECKIGELKTPSVTVDNKGYIGSVKSEGNMTINGNVEKASFM